MIGGHINGVSKMKKIKDETILEQFYAAKEAEANAKKLAASLREQLIKMLGKHEAAISERYMVTATPTTTMRFDSTAFKKADEATWSKYVKASYSVRLDVKLREEGE